MSEYDILLQQVHGCTRCTLSQKRITAVPGEGNLSSDIVFIGEGPGFYEDQQGRPFVGRAGQLLEELLESIGLGREEVYITNMVKCRPPNNRDPLPGEIQACKPFLDRQLEMIRPKVVVTLGRYSFSKFFPNTPIGKARGKPRTWNGLVVYPMYHPAAALRNGSFRTILETDFRALPSIVANALPLREEPAADDTTQLSLF